MARPTSREAQFSNTLPASVRGVDRRSLLRGASAQGPCFGGASLCSARVAATRNRHRPAAPRLRPAR
jgi:hypothetical protein